MDLSPIITTAAVVNILANAFKVWESGSTRLGAFFKTLYW